MKNDINSDLIRGHINTIILRALDGKDKYGAEIMKEIEDKSRGAYEIKQPTLYSALTRLSEDGLVSSYWNAESGGGRRKYFSLTEKGKQEISENKNEWEYTRAVLDNLIRDEDNFSTETAEENLSVEQRAKEYPDKIDNLSQIEEIESDTADKPVNVDTDNKEDKYKELPPLPAENEITPETQAEESGMQDIETEIRAEEKVSLLPHRQQGVIDYVDIQEKAAFDGIKIRTQANKYEGESGADSIRYLFYQKLLSHTIFAIFIVLAVELLVFFLSTAFVFKWGIDIYLGFGAAALILPIAASVIFLTGEKKKKLSNFNFKNTLLNSFVVFSFCYFIVLLASLVFAWSIIDPYNLLSKIILPLIILSNIPLSVVVYEMLLKTKKYYEKK